MEKQPLKLQISSEVQPFGHRPNACEPREPPSSASAQSGPAGSHDASGEARCDPLAAVPRIPQIKETNHKKATGKDE